VQQPLREWPWSRLIVALYRCGPQAEALQAYRDVRQLLADQLGIVPGPELTATHHAVLNHSFAVAAPAAVRRVPPGDEAAPGAPPGPSALSGLSSGRHCPPALGATARGMPSVTGRMWTDSGARAVG
jgi:hypothetical protein